MYTAFTTKEIGKQLNLYKWVFSFFFFSLSLSFSTQVVAVFFCAPFLVLRVCDVFMSGHDMI